MTANKPSPEQPILIVDDEEQYLFSISTSLAMSGMNNTVLCQDSRQVEDLLDEREYSLMLLDLSMPYVSGDDVVSMVAERKADIPVVIVTALQDADHAVKSIKKGVFDYLIKPVDKTRLITTVARALEFQRLHKENQRMKDFLLSDDNRANQFLHSPGHFASDVQLLSRTREEYQTLFYSIPIPTFILDQTDYSLMYCNQALAEFFLSSDPKTLCRKKVKILNYFVPEIQSRFLQILEVEGKATNYEIQGQREDGSTFTILLSCEIAPAEGYISGSFIDISQRKTLEDHVRHNQKMEALGRLAGGIAHDFNNLLGGISGYATLLAEEKELPLSARESIDGIVASCKTAKAVIEQLHGFSRRPSLEIQTIPLNNSISSMQGMLGKLSGINIEHSLKLNAQPDSIRVAAGQIEQLLINLVINARDAMPEGGTITIETENAEITTNGTPEVGYLNPGRYVQLTVQDTGVGMDRDTVKRIFEPYFTTKPTGKGTGLGLATVFGIVKQAGGAVRVNSEPGRGSEFIVYLPEGKEVEA